MKAFGATCAVILCAAASAAAQDATPYVVEGPGRLVCADFVQQDPQGEDRRLMAAWMTGYLTAHNRLTPQVFDMTAWQSPGLLLGMLVQYCAANPDEIVERGAQELIGYLAPRSIRDPAEVTALENGGSVVLLYVPVVARVRARLNELGYDNGTTDADLFAAIATFQEAEGLEATGLPDQRTLSTLLR